LTAVRCNTPPRDSSTDIKCESRSLRPILIPILILSIPLERAFKHMPEVAEDREERFVLPSPVVFIEGKTTIFENFDALCDRLNRDKEHIMKFLLNELGTAGKIVGNRAIFQGRFSREEIERQIRRYVDEYVMCWECNKPDTHFVKMERIWVLKCDACGAIRPLRRKAGVKSRK